MPSAGSPMTTSAAKDMFLPPLTTLVTRLMETTSSLRLRRFASIFFLIAIILCIAFWPPPGGLEKSLELETRFAGGVGEGLDTAVIEIAAAVEDDLRNALFLGALGDLLTDFLGSGDVAAGGLRL